MIPIEWLWLSASTRFPPRVGNFSGYSPDHSWMKSRESVWRLAPPWSVNWRRRECQSSRGSKNRWCYLLLSPLWTAGDFMFHSKIERADISCGIFKSPMAQVVAISIQLSIDNIEADHWGFASWKRACSLTVTYGQALNLSVNPMISCANQFIQLFLSHTMSSWVFKSVEETVIEDTIEHLSLCLSPVKL